ncbi:MAG TPA: hypothetical protein VGM06_01960 [Polyangiaceae bacterium]
MIDDAERERRFARLAHRYTRGDRVRATCEIVYCAAEGQAVPEGTQGTVDVPDVHGMRGLSIIDWDNDMREPTLCDSVEPLGGPRKA